MFNSLIAKEKGIVKMVDGSTCKIVTGTCNVIGRHRTMLALEAVRYIPEAWYNIISKGVLDKERCRIHKCRDN